MRWITESNRWKHLLGGALLGLLSDGWWCACLVGASAGGAMEFKDAMYGGKWDWADLACTLVGAMAGQAVIWALT